MTWIAIIPFKSIGAVLFWGSAAFVVWTYLLYPLVVAGRARWFGKDVRADEAIEIPVSIVLAAYNEGGTIGRRVEELRGQVSEWPAGGEVIVVSDGSTDRTVEIVRGMGRGCASVIPLPCNMGKAAALNAGCTAARYPIIVFADARQRWAPDALKRMLRNFADPEVGAVSGDLVLETSPGVMAGVGLYWRYEKWLRRQESRVHSMVGVTGAICAVRKELFEHIPRGTILDDVYWPLRVAMKGRRVIHETEARAYDHLPQRTRDEFGRKVRTLGANFQLLSRLPQAVLPWKNPIWFEFISHKLFRLLAPWGLLIMLGGSACLEGSIYYTAFWLQAGFYLVGVIGIEKRVGARLRLASAAASFVVLNAAAWLGFWVWACGGASRSWRKVCYDSISLNNKPDLGTLPGAIPARGMASENISRHDSR